MKILRFIITGGCTALVYLSLSYVMGTLIGINYLIATVVSYTLALVFNFVMQKVWSFQNSSTKELHKETSYYIGWSLVALGLNTFLVFIQVETFHLWYILAQLIASGIVAILSFFAYRAIFEKK